ncbi:DUF2059 domain-containing protein [Allosphingosinicella flava]|uniref:DUF2059 domain-containing protein n=1 Tax=Allosphingosinicella flava TaxID=2771430 RepID=A0A7T2GJF1_9SPHN|nr:DUF2059 domain-containing protein [Sphingosinicella flava]QPQ54949.1 DUF2059 domain-containing protein [Sphingosinicella flava]
MVPYRDRQYCARLARRALEAGNRFIGRGFMRYLLAMLCLSAASPASAAQAISVVPDLPAANMEAAQAVIDLVWPLGTYKRMMDTTAKLMTDNLVLNVMDMKVGDLGPIAGDEVEEAEAGQTLQEVAVKTDPHFKERFAIFARVATEEMGALINGMEPEMRSALMRAYARRFQVQELLDMKAFFETPTGRRYATESVLIMQDPEVLAMAQSFQPRFMEALPGIMKKVEAATAHLPPPPKSDEEPLTGK